MLDEAERSLHDALCVIRSLVKKRYLLAGGGAPEVEVAMKLEQLADTLTGKESFCVRAFASALDVIPTTLAENAGHNPISVLTELRARHRQGERFAGVTAKKGVANMWEENVVQPLLVTSSTMQLATECVRMILKIDDIVRVLCTFYCFLLYDENRGIYEWNDLNNAAFLLTLYTNRFYCIVFSICN